MSSLNEALGYLTGALSELKLSMARQMALKQMVENTITASGEASRKLEVAKNNAYRAIGPRAGNITGLMVVLDDKASQYVQGAQQQLALINEYLTAANQLQRELESVIAQIRSIIG